MQETETIRRHFQRRQRAIPWVLAAVGLTSVAALECYRPEVIHRQAFLVGVMLCVGISPFLIIYMRKTYRCPRCGASFFGMHRMEKVGRFNVDMRQFWERWDACPKCGVSFDDPWQ